ncbi:hypothetical protein WN51_02506 [Melipona quadrifasciata]|uniref:Uncharacterized protein n=1 Tax=Melipona quadrifasciata TaxID=166423 RepID=A0A0M8ZSW2_9HYME|nr:hypothetical protein WN51_02506 [Melipona quadrifasciata]
MQTILPPTDMRLYESELRRILTTPLFFPNIVFDIIGILTIPSLNTCCQPKERDCIITIKSMRVPPIANTANRVILRKRNILKLHNPIPFCGIWRLIKVSEIFHAANLQALYFHGRNWKKQFSIEIWAQGNGLFEKATRNEAQNSQHLSA